MIEASGLVDQPNPTLKRSSLSKYEIPIDHLTYEYVGACKDVKELEKILRILRSGEEGFYPELQKSAEEQLSLLSPNSRQLRKEEPMLTRNNMSNEEWKSIENDFRTWNKEVSVRDLRLTEENNNNMEEIGLPPVRQPSAEKDSPEKKADDSTPETKPATKKTDWDKYDADAELLKVDLEEEREKEEQQKQRRHEEMERLKSVVKEAEKLGDAERQILAEQENNRGNEYFQTKDFNAAIEYYSSSIKIWPTAKSYNNRAACYLKQCRYSNVLRDTNTTLELEPDNVKALYRRGIALQHKNRFTEALEDMNAVLRQYPKHVLAQHVSQELREQIPDVPRMVRVMTDEGFNKTKVIFDMTSEEMAKDDLPPNSFEVNEWGLPKVMCQCSTRSRFPRHVPKYVPKHYPDKCLLPFYDPQSPSMGSDSSRTIVDDSEVSKSPPQVSIIELDKPGTSGSYFRHKKYDIISDRTLARVLPDSNESAIKLDDSKTQLPIEECNVNSGDSGMDEDFELNPPLPFDMLDEITDQEEEV